ncbi:MAG: hypothetical protein AAFP82_22875, partial [Bacteroidota bacterium]
MKTHRHIENIECIFSAKNHVNYCAYAFHIRYTVLVLLSILSVSVMSAQTFEGGVEYTYGRSYTTFNGNLADIVGFQELEITEADLDTAFATFDLSAPRWVKELFPGLRLEIDQEISKQLSRNNNAVRFYGRF